jgi:Co/Zn/Cd efflux system component
MNDPTAKPAWDSSDMRVGITGLIVSVLAVLKAAGIHPTIFGYDWMSIPADQLAAYVTSIGGFLISGYMIWKRVQRGNDPSNTLQPIENPIATVKRMSSGVTKP